MKQYLHRFRSGVIAGYFTAVFLLASTLLVCAASNDLHRLRTVENLQEARRRTGREAAVLRDLKCRLEAGEETDSPVWLTVPGEENIVLAVFVDTDTDEIIYWVEQCRKP